MKLGEKLIQNKLVTTEQLKQALEIQSNQSEQKLGEILIKLGYLTADALQKALDTD